MAPGRGPPSLQGRPTPYEQRHRPGETVPMGDPVGALEPEEQEKSPVYQSSLKIIIIVLMFLCFYLLWLGNTGQVLDELEPFELSKPRFETLTTNPYQNPYTDPVLYNMLFPLTTQGPSPTPRTSGKPRPGRSLIERDGWYDASDRCSSQQSSENVAEAATSSTSSFLFNSSAETPHFDFDTLFSLKKRFLDAFMYPNNVGEARYTNSSLLAPNVLGRIEGSRIIAGRELNTEYLFGAFASSAMSSTKLSIPGYPTSYTLTKFTANQNIASSAAKISFRIPALDLALPLELLIWVTFNAAGQVSQYDVAVRNLGPYVAELVSHLRAALATDSLAATRRLVKASLARSICAAHTTLCRGPNQQYHDYDACVAHLVACTRLGGPYELGADTVLCRMLHELLVVWRPDVHCPHIGPDGGGVCVDGVGYREMVGASGFTTAPWLPFGK